MCVWVPVKDIFPQKGTCREHGPKQALFPSCASSLEAKGEAREVEAHRPPSKALLASFTWAVWAALDSIPQANRTIQFIHFPIYSV